MSDLAEAFFIVFYSILIMCAWSVGVIGLLYVVMWMQRGFERILHKIRA